jgi:hypothetical protein
MSILDDLPPPSEPFTLAAEKPRPLDLGELPDAALEALVAEASRILGLRAYVRDTLLGWSQAARGNGTLQ